MCTMAAERWQHAAGEHPGESAGSPASAPKRIDAPWPDGLPPEFQSAALAIARTEPAYAGRNEIRESSTLALDMIAAAEHSVYIEAQYLTAKRIGAALSKQLKKADGPDVVIVMTRKSHGLLERLAMSENRDRLMGRLARADRFGRLRVLYPVVPGAAEEIEVLIHSKLIIIDDRAIRIGSSNLNNRSIGLDTECDVALEAVAPETRRAVAGVRNRLLAEHLDCRIDEVETAIAADGLANAVDRLNCKPRGLRSFGARAARGPFRPILGTRLLDPERIFRLPWPFR
jgi:phosphatidylserine/phosphatidylglycerophosphate/cardiolipin synthase-like enzyme